MSVTGYMILLTYEINQNTAITVAASGRMEESFTVRRRSLTEHSG